MSAIILEIMHRRDPPSVCIIGGGPAGLSALRFVAQVTPNVLLFEAKA